MSDAYVPRHMAPAAEKTRRPHLAVRADRSSEDRRRVEVFDLVRGLALISMIVFHTCYDLAYIGDLASFGWFAPPLEDLWRCSISWTFLLVAGCMCLYSRSNFKRAAKYLVVALLVWVATTVAAVDTPISFGIVFCMGACTLVYAILDLWGIAPRGYAAAAVCLLLFLSLLGLQDGSVWAFGANLAVPDAAYASRGLAWLGLPGRGFASGDYYPLLPHVFLFMAGAAIMARWHSQPAGTPRWLYARTPAALRWVGVAGRYTLWIYLVHQPLILGILMLAGVL